MAQNNPLVNGNAYSFSQVIVNMLGVSVPGVTAIDYKEVQAKENINATGTRPVARGRGVIEPDGSITLLMTDIEGIRDAAPDGSLLKIPPFDIVVTYENAGKVVNHVLKNCEFLEDGIGGATGDLSLEMQLPLVISNIVFRQ